MRANSWKCFNSIGGQVNGVRMSGIGVGNSVRPDVRTGAGGSNILTDICSSSKSLCTLHLLSRYLINIGGWQNMASRVLY